MKIGLAILALCVGALAGTTSTALGSGTSDGDSSAGALPPPTIIQLESFTTELTLWDDPHVWHRGDPSLGLSTYMDSAVMLDHLCTYGTTCYISKDADDYWNLAGDLQIDSMAVVQGGQLHVRQAVIEQAYGAYFHGQTYVDMTAHISIAGYVEGLNRNSQLSFTLPTIIGERSGNVYPGGTVVAFAVRFPEIGWEFEIGSWYVDNGTSWYRSNPESLELSRNFDVNLCQLAGFPGQEDVFDDIFSSTHQVEFNINVANSFHSGWDNWGTNVALVDFAVQDLCLLVIPEPATLSLLALGTLAVMRHPLRRSQWQHP